ncbi:tannase/feruloyl esterase family alpha/beta hydrolase [Nocardia aurantia]|uniref:Tannase/feruloyl esterase family alpha/beta hydrolase n=1 Tax=Nocardia aurantia TaxID=2585199 RepID=A0A7K0DPN8_9NOCA|nr:tannase/feruloyl esterase family alpha/beta hydrolase [Nocardia aurantia]MQY27661.1 hypothetical protein [Nocardia aurantia]
MQGFPGPQRMRWLVLVAAALTGVLVAVTGCSSGHAPAPPPASPGVTTAPPAPPPSVPRLAAGEELPVQIPRMGCPDLSTHDFSRLTEGAVSIALATMVSKSDSTPYDYCQVVGFVEPQIGFELRLPTTTYRGRYLQQGCGGYCGVINLALRSPISTGCAPLTDGTMVVGQDDQGHRDTGPVDVWATDPQLKVDFGYRSEHVFAAAAKAVITAFYGAAPRYSYYDGCSDGGREALMEAQRYPTDFDGVLAGAAAFNQTALNGFEEAYLSTVDFRPDGSVILPAAKVDVLHDAVIRECADPDLGAGTIQDPRSCDFDPGSIACPDGPDRPDCLTGEQVDVVRKIYTGVVDSGGTHLYTGGEAIGSEPQWVGLIVPRDGQRREQILTYRIGAGFLRWLGTWKPDPGKVIDESVFTVDNLKGYLESVGGLYDATDPDLSAFAQRGGKLIQWHGWSDGYIPPVGSITYRQAVIDKLGKQIADGFYRLYMFPGMFHCQGGYGPSHTDLLTPLLDWTERDRTPNAVIATKTTADSDGRTATSGPLTQQDPNARPVTARPVYPYPTQTAYKGSGDRNNAANYAAILPQPHDDHYKWGGGDFRSGYQLWCTSDGRELSCNRTHP